jgi:transposase InsO family protein
VPLSAGDAQRVLRLAAPASCGEAKMELFDYIEVFYNQRRRHSTLGQISPAEFEKRASTRRR